MEKDYDVELSNMLLTYEAEKRFKILWVKISFRDRFAGKSTHKIFKSITMIFQLEFGQSLVTKIQMQMLLK